MDGEGLIELLGPPVTEEASKEFSLARSAVRRHEPRRPAGAHMFRDRSDQGRRKVRGQVSRALHEKRRLQGSISVGATKAREGGRTKSRLYRAMDIGARRIIFFLTLGERSQS